MPAPPPATSSTAASQQAAETIKFVCSVSVDGNNHITTSGFRYDAAGNMLQDGSSTGYSYSFDAENRLVNATGMTGRPYC